MIDKLLPNETRKLELHFQNSAADRSGQAGAETVNGSFSYVDGINGKAGNFVAANSNSIAFANIAKTSTYIGANPYSMKAKIKCSAAGGVRAIAADHNSTSSSSPTSYMRIDNTTGYVRGWQGLGTSAQTANVTSTLNICDGRWHTLELQWEGTGTTNKTIRLLVDGVVLNSINPSPAGFNNTTYTSQAFRVGQLGVFGAAPSYLNDILDSLVITTGGQKTQKTHNANFFRRKG